ncbi:hypothetical protein RUND412_007900 [Rhizina undulata]
MIPIVAISDNQAGGIPSSSMYGIWRRDRIPPPGAEGAPMFDGNEVTKLVEHWEWMVEEYSIREDMAVKRLPLYCRGGIISEYVRAMPAYNEGNWIDIKKELLKEFKEQDSRQRIYTRSWLDTLALKQLGS